MLTQPAPNMATLLVSLKEVIFENKNHDRNIEERGPIDRDGSFGALTQILYDQAEKDGFKLITINTESKRAILACNRQGRPPATSSQTGELGCTSASSTVSKGRAGTSIRCGCRMRVNINYHVKLRGWRITSYEISHNHHYGSHFEHTEDGKIGFEQAAENFEFTKMEADQAIAKYSARAAEGQTPSRRRASRIDHSAAFDEHDAARMLQALSSSVSPSSSNSSTGQEQMKRRLSDSSILSYRDLEAIPVEGDAVVPETGSQEVESSFKRLISKARRNSEWIDEVSETIKILSEKFESNQMPTPQYLSTNDVLLDATDLMSSVISDACDETGEFIMTTDDSIIDDMNISEPSPKKQRIVEDSNVTDDQMMAIPYQHTLPVLQV